MYGILFAYMVFSSIFYLFICHLLFCNISFFLSLLLNFLTKFWLNYTHELYIHTLLIIVAYFINTFYCRILCCFMRYFQYFSSPFPAFIIMSICTYSHGSAKHWLHSSLSIHWYILTSTKVEFLGSLCSSDETDLSVIQQVTLCSYRLYFCLKIMSVILHVVSCHTCFYVYNIYRICNVKLFRKI